MKATILAAITLASITASATAFASAVSAAPMSWEGRGSSPFIHPYYARMIPNKPPLCYGRGCRGPIGPICRTFFSPPGPCETWGGTPTGHPPYTCVVCN
jgi:hypothetical protein